MTTEPKQNNQHVTVTSAVALYVASVLGGGILVLPGLTAATAGAGALVAWIAVSVICLPIAMMFGRLSSVLPDAGGVSSFVRHAFGDTLGDITGWLYFWVIPFGQPAVMLSGLAYANYEFGLPRAPTYILAWVVLCASCMLNITGTRVSARAQSALTGIIILLLFATIVAGLSESDTAAYHPPLPHGWASVGSAAALIMWAYVGWENVSSIAEEFRNPKRDFVISVVISMVIIGGLYAGATATVLGVVPVGQEDIRIAPIALVLNVAIGSWASWVATGIAILIVTGSAMAIIWGTSSLGASLARSGSLPAKMAIRNQKDSFKTSVLVLLSAYTVVLIVMYLGWVQVEDAARIVGGSAIITYGLCAIAYIRLIRPKRLTSWLLPIITVAFVVVLLPFFGKMLFVQLIIVLIYFALRTTFRRDPSHAQQKSQSVTSRGEEGFEA